MDYKHVLSIPLKFHIRLYLPTFFYHLVNKVLWYFYLLWLNGKHYSFCSLGQLLVTIGVFEYKDATYLIAILLATLKDDREVKEKMVMYKNDQEQLMFLLYITTYSCK